MVSVKLTYGKDKAIKSLIIGSEKAKLRKKGEKSKNAATSSDSTLYLAKDDSRAGELFFVNKDLIDKLDKSFNDLRDKSLAAFQRWDIDSIILGNAHGRFAFLKTGGEWFFGDEKKKADFDAVSGILDALGSDTLEWIDHPSGLSRYGLDKPTVQVILKQGSDVWLNTPRVGREASGTSGMSASMNGSVHLSTNDGWHPEFAKDNINSFTIPSSDASLSVEQQDYEDNKNLLDILENKIIPLYYNEPKEWIRIVKHAMSDVIPAFDSGRMVHEYYIKMYDAEAVEQL